ETTVTAQDDGDDRAGVELGRAKQAQLGEQRRCHLLRLVDEQHRAKQRLLDVLLPLRAYRLVRAPAVRARDGEPEEVAELAIEVGDATLRPGHFTDHHVTQRRQLGGEQAERRALAGTDVAGDEREAAVHQEVCDPPREVLDARCLAQRLDGDVLEKRVPLETVEGGELACVHQPSSLRTYAGGSPARSYAVMSWRKSGAISGMVDGVRFVVDGRVLATSATGRRRPVAF